MSWGWMSKTTGRASPRPALGALAGIMVTVAGCQHAPVSDRSSIDFLIPEGATFTLHRPITIPPREAHVYIQDGAVHPLNGTNLYYPHCKLGVADIGDAPRTVAPGGFQITRVRRYVDHILLVDRAGLQLAALGLRLAQGDGGSDGPTDYMYVTAMRLHSDRQPQVRDLHCQQLDDPGLGRHVSYEEIRQSLGDLATIRPPGEAPSGQ